MNILHITSWDSFGIQFNGYLLSKALHQLGHSANMLVSQQQFDEPFIERVGSPTLRKLDGLLHTVEKKLSIQRLLPRSFYQIPRHPWYEQADIIHFQLPHATNFLNLNTVEKISHQKKLVWTIHDPWLLTGHCIYPMGCERWKTGCGNCPDLQRDFAIQRDNTKYNWNIKHKVFERANVHIVVASQWMYEMVKESPLLSRFECDIIPFGINADVFKPLDKSICKKNLQIPSNAYVLACRWVDNPVKGVEYIEEALKQRVFDRPVYFVTLDGSSQKSQLRQNGNYHFIDLGWVNDQTKLAEVFNAADLFLMPSIAEAFGVMAIEAMACGTPVVVFEGTALPSVIKAPEGSVAIPQNAEDLGNTIHALLDDPVRREKISHAAVNIIRLDYTFEKYISRHIDLYKNILAEPSHTRTP